MKTSTHSLLFLSAALSLFAGDLFAAGSKPRKPDLKLEAAKAEAIAAYNAGTAHLTAAEYEEAEADLKAALEKDAKLAEAHNNLAFVLRKQGPDRYKEAMKHYNRAIRLNRKLAEAYMYRGVLHVTMGNERDAEKDLKRLTKLSPDLAEELKWVIENGKEKEPAQFFGVTKPLAKK